MQRDRWLTILAVLGTTALLGCEKKDSPATEVPAASAPMRMRLVRRLETAGSSTHSPVAGSATTRSERNGVPVPVSANDWCRFTA